MKPHCLLGFGLLWVVASGFPGVEAGEPAPDLLPASLRASEQHSPGSLALDDWQRVQNLPLGARLRVALRGARVQHGRLENVTEEALTLRISRKKLETEPRDDVVRVHVGQRDSLTNGALIGLGIGAGIGAALGWAGIPSPVTPLDEDRYSRGTFVATGLALGAALGTGIGTLTDYSQLKLMLVYERSIENKASGSTDGIRPRRRSLCEPSSCY